MDQESKSASLLSETPRPNTPRLIRATPSLNPVVDPLTYAPKAETDRG